MEKAKFPSPDWLQAIKQKLNTDDQYAQIARNWEGDMRVIIEADGTLKEDLWLYFDLWHGKCREAIFEDQSSALTPALQLKTPYPNIVKILSGEVGVMQALMTRMVSLKGSMTLIMRNVPTVLDFIRCCQEVTSGWI